MTQTTTSPTAPMPWQTPPPSTYNNQNLLETSQNRRGHQTHFAYNPLHQATHITDALNNVTQIDYDRLGRPITLTNALNQVTVNVYDGANNLVQITQNYNPAHGQNHQNTHNLTTRYAYDGANRPTHITDTLGQVSKYDYDSAGRLATLTQNYDPHQGENAHNEYNLKTHYTYDDLGRLETITDPLGRQTRTTYNNRNLIAQSIVNFQNGIYTSLQPDTDLITTYHYDENGNLSQMVDVLGRVTHFDYDALNRLKTRTHNYQPSSSDPAANLSTHYSYNALGQITTKTNALNQTTRYYYDDLNRLEKIIENHHSGTYANIPDPRPDHPLPLRPSGQPKPNHRPQQP